MTTTTNDSVFKALADESRRTLLDALFRQDGQTLSELEAILPMTRFGAMKHLRILEEAGLITTRKVGREKFHYLNPVPIQLVYDRWVSKYAQPWTSSLAGLKYALESPPMNERPAHIYRIFIQTTPERLWQALTDGDITQQYYFGTRVKSDWKPGSPYSYHYDTDEIMVKGTVLEVEAPTRLVTTFEPTFVGGEVGAQVSKVTFEIEEQDGSCLLKLTHEDLDPAQPLTEGIMEGWAKIFSNLKTLLEQAAQ